MTILFTCAGRRTYLLKYFKENLAEGDKIVATDMQLSAPALQVADVKVQVPAVFAPDYVEVTLKICEEYGVDALISLNDLELPILSENRPRFEAIGVKVIVSDPSVIDICFDKYKTAKWIESIGLDSPKTYTRLEDAKNALASGEISFPLFMKPRWGSGSIGLESIADTEELDTYYRLLQKKIKRTILSTASVGDEYILIQEKLTGSKFGLDVMNDLEGNNVAVSVKQILAMRSGETDKAVTADLPMVREMGRRIGSELKHIGNLDVDIMQRSNGDYCVLELNPRFGGGFLFSYEAGVNFPKAIIEWLGGNAVDPSILQPTYGRMFAKNDYLMPVGVQNDLPAGGGKHLIISHLSPHIQQEGYTRSKVKDIAIFGAGGFGKEVACLIMQINAKKPTWNLIGFFDDNATKIGTQVSSYGKVLGTVDALNAWESELAVVVAIGSSESLRNVVSHISNPKIYFPNLIHPSVWFADDSYSIGKGNIIQGACCFSCDVHLGNFNVLNGFINFGHDDVVGNYNVFMPSVRVSGGVIIGDGNFFGVSSIVLQQIKIGNNVRLGAGSVLMRKPKEGNLYIGNPAKIFNF